MPATEEAAAFDKSPILASATQIISAHLGNNPVALPDVPGFIKTVFSTLAELEGGHHPKGAAEGSGDAFGKPAAPPVPAVNVDGSVQNDYIICLEDGKKLRMLKRYLMAQYHMTPEQYRSKWGLPNDYPMVAPVVSDQRRRAAKDNGLGRTVAKKTMRKRSRTAR